MSQVASGDTPWAYLCSLAIFRNNLFAAVVPLLSRHEPAAQEYKMKTLVATTLFVFGSVAIAPAQTGTPGAQPTPAQGKQKGMMQGGMSGMMEHCKMHCRDNMTAMSTLSKQVEEARQSNDVTKMRAALDAVAKHHTEMRQHMQTCMRNTEPGDSKAASPGTQGGDHQHHPGSAPRK